MMPRRSAYGSDDEDDLDQSGSVSSLHHNNGLKHALNSENDTAVEDWPRLDYHLVVPKKERQLAEGMTKAEVKSLSRSPYKEIPVPSFQRSERKRKQPTPTKMVSVTYLMLHMLM